MLGGGGGRGWCREHKGGSKGFCKETIQVCKTKEPSLVHRTPWENFLPWLLTGFLMSKKTALNPAVASSRSALLSEENPCITRSSFKCTSTVQSFQAEVWSLSVGELHAFFFWKSPDLYTLKSDLNAGFSKSYVREFISRIFCHKVKMHRTPPTLRFSKVSKRSRAQLYVCKRTWAKELTSAPLQFFDHPESSPPIDYTCRKPFQGTPAWNIESQST